MPSLEDEDLVVDILTGKGLRAERFSKEERRRGKTPDFRVFQGETLKFFCEVKSVEDDTWLDGKLDAAIPGEVVGGLRDDPVFNRLTDDIHQATAQFLAVNHDSLVPNVIVFVNHDSMCDEQDMISVLTGQFLANDGTLHRIYNRFSEGRIKNDKFLIHLFCWVEEGDFRMLTFNQTQPDHCNVLCNLLSFDPAGINPLQSN
ncbi:MAG: hypothetical protein WCI39_11400 [Gallionellaceae bacterium]